MIPALASSAKLRRAARYGCLAVFWELCKDVLTKIYTVPGKNIAAATGHGIMIVDRWVSNI